jgi:hypothetical protein
MLPRRCVPILRSPKNAHPNHGPFFWQVGSNTVFYAITFAIIYCSVSNIGGKVPNEIPLISESVDAQMPF